MSANMPLGPQSRSSAAPKPAAPQAAKRPFAPPRVAPTQKPPSR